MSFDKESESLGFSSLDELPVRYIDRTHAWYDALGTNNHYPTRRSMRCRSRDWPNRCRNAGSRF